VLSQRRAAQWVLEGDIRSCFDRISHEWLLANVPVDTAILRKWLKAGFMERSTLFPTRDGTPQGGIISPVLANLALDGLQPLLRRLFPVRSGKKVNLVRYADDFIITGASRGVLEEQVRPLVEEFLDQRGLELSLDKTVTTHIDEGFDFLGQNIRKYGGKLLIKPSKASLRSVRRAVSRIVKSSGSLTAGQLIARLNPLLRGWANYHRHVVSSRAFRSLDHHVRHALHRWAKRRHPKRTHAWLLRQYYTPHAGRSHRFTGFAGASRHGSQVWLFHAADVPVRRHMLVRGAANPHDPAWGQYFRLRRRSTLLPAHMPGQFSASPHPVTEVVAEA
jgi:RNA-directed DNA polymerase